MARLPVCGVQPIFQHRLIVGEDWADNTMPRNNTGFGPPTYAVSQTWLVAKYSLNTRSTSTTMANNPCSQPTAWEHHLFVLISRTTVEGKLHQSARRRMLHYTSSYF